MRQRHSVINFARTESGPARAENASDASRQRRASPSVRFAVASIVEPPSRTCASEDSVLSWVTISDNLSLIESRRASRAESHAGACDRLMERRVENVFRMRRRMRRRRRNGKRKGSRLKLLSLPLSPPSPPPPPGLPREGITRNGRLVDERENRARPFGASLRISGDLWRDSFVAGTRNCGSCNLIANS